MFFLREGTKTESGGKDRPNLLSRESAFRGESGFPGAIQGCSLRNFRSNGKRGCAQFDLSYCQFDIAEFRTQPGLTCLKFCLWLRMKCFEQSAQTFGTRHALQINRHVGE